MAKLNPVCSKNNEKYEYINAENKGKQEAARSESKHEGSIVREDKEDELDRILMKQADEFAATESLSATISVNPWAGSIGYLVWGFLLLSFHVNFFGFPPEFVFTMLGLLLIMRGFAQIAHLSSWLRGGFIISLITSLWYAGNLILDCTPVQMPDAYQRIITIYMTAVRIVLFYLLYRGLTIQVEQEEQRERVAEDLKTNLKWLITSYIAVAIGIYLEGTWLVWVVTFFYLVFLHQIYQGLSRVRKILEEYAYGIRPAPGYVGARVRWLMIGVVIVLALGMPFTMYLTAKPDASVLSEDVYDGSDRIFYGMTPDELFQLDGLPEDRTAKEWMEKDWTRFFADIDAECTTSVQLISGEEKTQEDQGSSDQEMESFQPPNESISETKVQSIRDQMILAGVDEDIVHTLPASEIVRYEGITDVYREETWEPYIVQEGDPITYKGYLCYMEETDTYRFLFYGSWREMPRSRYTDGIVLRLLEYGGPYSDLTGGTIGENEQGYFFHDMDAVSFSLRGDVRCQIGLTLPVPQDGERYDYYLGMDCIPFPYAVSADSRSSTIDFYFEMNFFHRDRLWCYPGQTAAEMMKGYTGNTVESMINWNSDNQVMENLDYFMMFVTEDEKE